MLEFKNINWESNILELIIHKTGKALILPLLEDVGMAIIDYIKYAGLATSSPVVFQTCNAPIQPISAPLRNLFLFRKKTIEIEVKKI